MIYSFVPQTVDIPIGGIKTLFDYIIRANQLSGQTIGAVLSSSNQPYNWLPQSYRKVKIISPSISLSKKDVIIIPEVTPEKINFYKEAGFKILAVLNWSLYKKYLRNKTPEKLGYHAIITNSIYTRTFLKKQGVSLPIYYLKPFIDSSYYSIKRPLTKRPHNSILILNRKNTQHISPILQYLKDIPHKLTIVNNLHPSTLSSLLNENQIFINLGYPEGFGRPAAEAMSSGCIVVGFTGGGGREFMKDGFNSFVAKDGDEKNLIEKLDFIINHLRIEEKEKISQKARDTIVELYNPINQAKSLHRLFKHFLPHPLSYKKIKEIYKQPTYRKIYISEEKLLLDRLQRSNSYLQRMLVQKEAEFMSSKIYRVWRLYRSLIESKPLSIIEAFFESIFHLLSRRFLTS